MFCEQEKRAFQRFPKNVKSIYRFLDTFNVFIKKYIVCLTAPERLPLVEFVKKQKGKFLQVRHAQILLNADTDGPCWNDGQIGAGFDDNVRVVTEIRKRFAARGVPSTMDGLSRPPKRPFLTAKQGD